MVAALLIAATWGCAGLTYLATRLLPYSKLPAGADILIVGACVVGTISFGVASFVHYFR